MYSLLLTFLHRLLICSSNVSLLSIITPSSFPDYLQSMNIANYLPYSNQSASVRGKMLKDVILTLFRLSIMLNQETISMC